MRRTLLLTLAFAALAVAAQAADQPVKVFILTGQSNMEGKAKLSLLEYQIKAPETRELFAHLHHDGKWVEREDVHIKFLGRKGKLTVGYGSPNCIGPELEFGNTVGDHYDQPVVIIKAAWGGKSLYRDFRPPSSGMPSDEKLAAELEQTRKKNPKATLDEVKERYGHYYRELLKEVNDTLANLKDVYPDYHGQGYELAGVVWFQGWNDMINPEYTAAYPENMANFIRDLRKDLKSPGLPFVIGQLGVGGVGGKPNSGRDAFKAAQAAPATLPEFRGNVALVKTDQYWDTVAQAVYDKGWKEHLDEWNKVGSDRPYHYLGSARCYSAIGKAFAEAVIGLQKK